MRKKFSVTWKSSKQPRKQRKYRYNAPLHIKNKFISVHLSKELKKKYNKRSLSIKKGDKVKIVRGQFKGKRGNVDKVDLKGSKIYVSGMDVLKKDGSKTTRAIEPSNLILTDLESEDKARQKATKRVQK